MPYYNSFGANPGFTDDMASRILIPHMAILSDRDGVEEDLTQATYNNLRTDIGKVKSVRLDRNWKIYRKSTVFPAFQKYPQVTFSSSTSGTLTDYPDHDMNLTSGKNIWGQWISSETTGGATRNAGIQPPNPEGGLPDGVRQFHIMMISKPTALFDGDPVFEGKPLGQIDFTVYHVLSDRR